jgi:hypothetical protein
MSGLKVVIDGVTYVPAAEAVAGMDALDAVMQAMFEGYMGHGERWNEKGNARLMTVTVSDGGDEGETFEDLAARLAQSIAEDGRP